MISIKPILEQAVIDALRAGRFDPDIDGYIMMDGENYLGHALYRVEGGVTHLLACEAPQNALVDGVVRACAAAGEDAGARAFDVNEADARLREWRSVFFKDAQMPVPNDRLFHHCK